MKKTIIFIVLVLGSYFAKSQHAIQGLVIDRDNRQPLPKATITLDGATGSAAADSSGKFEFRDVSPGKHTLTVRHVGYKTAVLEYDVRENLFPEIGLVAAIFTQPPVEIIATRAGENMALAYTNVSGEEISKINTGRDLPYLLESVPSLTATSDAGTGIGYTGIRIRGSDPTRINVTIDGIPINDSESQLVYWVNMPDLASSIDNVQVQRGVGTSTNGASAFGGSINIQTGSPSEKPYLVTTGAVGSFNTYKTNAMIGTGMLNNKWNFEGRLSKITSDGYIDRATADLKSFFVSGGYFGKKDIFKIKIFSGFEETYQAWNGVPEAALDTNRTWNYYTYENQVDHYQQDHYQLFYTHSFSDKFDVNTAFHYTYGRGYYEEYREDDPFSEYGLDPIISGSDTITTTDLVRRKWLDNDFYGMVFSGNYRPTEKVSIIGGGALNQYDGDHFGEIIWAQYASNGFIGQHYYDNNGLKTDFNVFGKATIEVANSLSIYADLQYRLILYDFTGFDDLGQPAPQSDELNFFNPKAGITWNMNQDQFAYLSFSTGNKEPSRDDYSETTQASRPLPERLYDIECGFRQQKTKYVFGLNYYLMLYENQLVLTGEINDVGNYTRTNIKNSYREGIEIDGAWNPVDKFTLSGNVTLSRNKIKEYREYTDDWDTGEQVLTIYKDTDIAFSPSITAFLLAGWKPIKGFEAQLAGKYIGEQYLDNTSNSNSTLDPWLVADLRFNYTLNPKFMKAITFTFLMNNLLDEMYESNGYSYSYYTGGSRYTDNYYYPQAGRNYLGMVTLSF